MAALKRVLRRQGIVLSLEVALNALSILRSSQSKKAMPISEMDFWQTFENQKSLKKKKITPSTLRHTWTFKMSLSLHEIHYDKITKFKSQQIINGTVFFFFPCVDILLLTSENCMAIMNLHPDNLKNIRGKTQDQRSRIRVPFSVPHKQGVEF